MSGLPHGLEASPHGDALLRPGKDYELHGSEIVAVPNRTGGGMTERKVEEALERLLTRRADDSDGYDDDAFFLAPIIERALRAAYWEGANNVRRANRIDKPGDGVFSDNGVTAGVGAMMEES